MSDEKRIFRPKEAAKYLGISRSTLDRMERAGELPRAIRYGEGPRAAKGWRVEDLDALIEQRRAAGDVS